MYPTYLDGESLLIRRTKNVNRLDPVIVKSDLLEENLCKRVIGIEGDKVEIKNNKVYVNDELLVEDYINGKMKDNVDINLTVDKDTVFVMGDNRNNSLDSRIIGTLGTDCIKGVVIFNLTRKLHYNRKIVFHVVCFSWIIVFIYLVSKYLLKYLKKEKK